MNHPSRRRRQKHLAAAANSLLRDLRGNSQVVALSRDFAELRYRSKLLRADTPAAHDRLAHRDCIEGFWRGRVSAVRDAARRVAEGGPGAQAHGGARDRLIVAARSLVEFEKEMTHQHTWHPPAVRGADARLLNAVRACTNDPSRLVRVVVHAHHR